MPGRCAQVVGAVGFQGARLPAPQAGDAYLLELCEQCRAADPAQRPEFQVTTASLVGTVTNYADTGTC